MNKLFDVDIIYYFKRNFISKYNLNRKKFNASKVLLPPELTKKYDEVNLDYLAKSEFLKYVEEFKNIIIKNIHPSNLTNFYNNINNLTITTANYDLLKKLLGKNLSATYNTKTNKIKLNNNGKENESIFHELFHMASAIFKGNTLYAGFKQQILNSKFEIGTGINEGYTQLLTERYFSDKPNTKYSYPFEKDIALQLEKIIGENKMQKFYFNANLLGLINELEKFASKQDILDFITNLDFICKQSNKLLYLPKHKDLIVSKLSQITTFLFNVYKNKLSDFYNKGLISKKEMIVNLQTFAIYLKNLYYIKKDTYIVDNNVTFVDDEPILNVDVHEKSVLK